MQKKNKYILLEGLIVIITLVMLAWVFVPRFLASQNINTAENFPDPVVRAAVEKFMEVEPGGYFNQRQAKEKNGELELTLKGSIIKTENNQQIFVDHINGIESIIEGVRNLTGLHYFSSITSLQFVASHKLSDINLSPFSKIQNIGINNSSILDISFAECPELVTVGVAFGILQSVDVTKNPNIESISFNHNRLKRLNVSQNSKLHTLQCSNNQLTELHLTNNPLLNQLWCNKNQITTIDFSQNPNLTFLHISENPVEEIDLRKQKSLTTLIIDTKQLFNASIKLHPSVKPSIRVINEKGRYISTQNYPLNGQKEIQEQIDMIINQSKTSTSENARTELSP